MTMDQWQMLYNGGGGQRAFRASWGFVPSSDGTSFFPCPFQFQPVLFSCSRHLDSFPSEVFLSSGGGRPLLLCLRSGDMCLQSLVTTPAPSGPVSSRGLCFLFCFSFQRVDRRIYLYAVNSVGALIRNEEDISSPELLLTKP